MLKASKDRLLAAKLTSPQKRSVAEVVGTFIVVVLATGSVVIDAKYGGRLGLPFIAFAPFVGVAIGVYLWQNINGSFQSICPIGLSNYETHPQTATLTVFCSRDYRRTSCKFICNVFDRN